MNVKAIQKQILITKNGFEREIVHDPIIPQIKELITPIERPEIVVVIPRKVKILSNDEFPETVSSTQSFYLDRVELIQVEIYKEV